MNQTLCKYSIQSYTVQSMEEHGMTTRMSCPPTKQQCNRGAVFCWAWVNRVSTSTWPGFKHMQQATACVKVRMFDPFFLENRYYIVYIVTPIVFLFPLSHPFDSYKLLWQCKNGLRMWKSPPAPNCLTKDFLPQGNSNQPTKVALHLLI